MSCSFGIASKAYLHISNDSKIHLWDIETKKEKRSYTDKNHLSHEYSCVCWRPGTKEHLGHCVVGFSDGATVVWDLMRGIVTRTIGIAHQTPAPSSIAIANDGLSVFIGTNESEIGQYDLASGDLIKNLTGGKKGTTLIAINPKAAVLAVSSGSALRIVDIETNDKRKLDASFQGGCSILKFSSCGAFLVAGSSRSRELVVFDVRIDAPLSPMCVLSLGNTPIYLDVLSIKKTNTIKILCLYEHNGGCVQTVIYSSIVGDNPTIEETNLSCSGLISCGQFVLGGESGRSLTTAGSGKELLLAVGQPSRPTFVTIDITDSSTGVVLADVDIDALASLRGASLHSGEGRGEHSSDSQTSMNLQPPEVLGPHQTGGTKKPVVSVNNSSGDVGAAVNLLESIKKRSRSGSDADASDSLTMEEKLTNLSKAIQDVEYSGLYSTEDRNDKLGTTPAPTTDSLVILVDQALQSGDDFLLEQCLNCSDIAVVDATASRLAANRVVPFLRKLVAKFEKRPSRSGLLTMWLTALLRHHTSYLVTVPDLSFQLAGLSQMLEQRLSSFVKLSSLAGRLDLLLSQVTYLPPVDADVTSTNASERVSVKKKKSVIEPRQTYVEM